MRSAPQPNEPNAFNINGKNLPNVWLISPEPQGEKHYATFPQGLITIPIIATCPIQICKKCGRVVLNSYKIIQEEPTENYRGIGQKDYESVGVQNPSDVKRRALKSMSKKKKLIGQDGCNCNVGFESGIILDPFAGICTTGVVAKKLNRQFIGIELNEGYIKIGQRRIEATTVQEELGLD